MLLAKKWGILIKKKPESLVFAGLEISRDYYILLEVSYGYTNDITYYFIVYFYNCDDEVKLWEISFIFFL